MSTYTIAVTPESGDQVQLRIRVEIGAETSRILEMSVSAAGPDGLSIGVLPGVDLEAIGRLLITGSGVGIGRRAAGRPDPQPDTTQTPTPTGAPTPAGAPARTRQRAAKAEPKKAVRTTRRPKAAAGAEQQGRAYRRMPDDVLETLERLGSVTKLAQHYEVPRHTAQGWVGRLRRTQA